MDTPVIRTSERARFKRCQWAWWMAWREGLVPKRTTDALAFGIWVHEAFKRWYCGPGVQRGPHPAETFKEIADDAIRYIKVQEQTDETAAQWMDLQQLGITLLEEYVSTYGQDERILVIAPEQTFHFAIPFPSWWTYPYGRRMLAKYAGTFDLIARDAETGFLWLWEHKTARTVAVEHLGLDEQGGTYWAMAERGLRRQDLIRPRDRLHGIMYNFLRKGTPDNRSEDEQGYKVNKDGSRSKRQPKPLFVRHPVYRTSSERSSQLRRVQTDAATMELYRRKELPVTKTPHHSCSRHCDFFQMCRLHESGGDWRSLRETLYDRRDPYADHRKSTDDAPSFEFG